MQKTVKSICGIFFMVAVMLVIIASVSQEKVHADYDERYAPRNIRWQGTSAVWDGANYENSYLDYEVSLFNVTGGRNDLIGTYYRGKGHSVDLKDAINSIDISGDGIDIALRVRSINTGVAPEHVYDYVSAETVTLHKIKFDSMEGTPVPDMVVFEGRTWNFPKDPTRDGYAFTGWYKTNDDFETESNRWDFERDNNESNMTLYAKWVADGQHVHQVNGEDVSFKPWARTRSLPTDGNYYLLYDVDLAYSDEVTGNVNLCLAGHTVTCGGNQIRVKSGGSLDLLDPEGEGKITGSSNVNGAVLVEGGNFTMHSGSITGNSAKTYGNDNGRGGGLRVNSGTAKMLGGSITNNFAEDNGGGVCVMGGSFELAGGTISGNRAGGSGSPTEGGAGIGVIGGSFIMSGGLITGNSNTDNKHGTAVHVRNGTFYVSGGTITGNGYGADAVFINAMYGGSMHISKDGEKTGTIRITANPSGNVQVNYGETIKVNGEIDEASEIGITPYLKPKQGEVRLITSGLSGKGSVSMFKSDNEDYAIIDAGSGEAAFKNNWKITYKPGDHMSGGEMDPGQVRIVDEENLTFPQCGYLPENGYEFAGWNVNNKIYQKDDKLKVTRSGDATATWKAIDYNIECDLDGGTLPEGKTNPVSYNIESEDITLAEPERKGYTFTGWTGTGIDGDTPVKDVVIKKGSMGERSYKANWEIIEYNITYKLNGGKLAEGKSNPATYTVEDEITLNKPERAKFIFKGWLGTGLEEEEEDLTIEKGSTGDRTYIAIFEEMCKDGHTPGDTVIENRIEATCEVDGSYEEVVYCSKCGDELSRTKKSIKAKGHDYDEPTYTWNDDNSMATATRVCKIDPEHKETETVKAKSEVSTPATCTEKGRTTYTATFTNEAFKEQTTTEEDIAALGHDYKYAGMEWSEDNSEATATFVCQHDPDHRDAAKAEVTSETIDSTCEKSGVTTYSATATYDGVKYTDTKTTGIDPKNHNWGEPEYTWSKDGSICIAERTCSNCDVTESETALTDSSVTKDPTCEDKGETTYTATFKNKAFGEQTKTLEDIAALGHNWGEPAYEWSKDNKEVTATRVCQNDKTHPESEKVETKSEITKPATCEAKGETTYTAEFKNEAFKKQTKTVEDIDALSHDWSEPTYKWNKDNSRVTATMTCKNDKSHEVIETVDTESSVTKEATCEEKGETTYTAKFSNKAFKEQTKTLEDTEALGHEYKYAGMEWSEDNSEATATFVCKHDAEHKDTAKAKVTSETIENICEKNGVTTYIATATYEGVTYTDIKTVGIDPKNHDWSDPKYTWSKDGSICIAERICSNCEVTELETAVTEPSVTKEATCEEKGETTYTAKFSNGAFKEQTKTIEDIAPLEHDYGEWTKLDDKEHQRVCAHNEAHVEKANHSWNAGEVTKEATTEAEGEKTYTCTVCKATKNEIIPKPTPDKSTVKPVLVAKGIAKGKTAVNFSWNKVSGADRYEIYMSKCNCKGKKYNMKKVKTVNGKTFKWTKKGLKKNTAYKFYVKALKKSGKNYKAIVKSKTAHFFTSNVRGKLTNPKSLKLNKSELTINKGKSATIKGTVTKVKKNKKLATGHAVKLRFISNNPSVATVNAKGKVTAKKAGTATIYVQTINGIWKTCKVTVK